MALDDQTCVPVPCPPFEETTVEVTGSAPVGHRLVEGFHAGDHTETPDPNQCAVCIAALQEMANAVVGREVAERHQHQTIALPWRSLPEGAKARLAEMTRHPQCLITGTHAAHDLLKASTSGFRCGGHSKPPRP